MLSGTRVVQFDMSEQHCPSKGLVARVTCQVRPAAWVPCWPALGSDLPRALDTGGVAEEPDYVEQWRSTCASDHL